MDQQKQERPGCTKFGWLWLAPGTHVIAISTGSSNEGGPGGEGGAGGAGRPGGGGVGGGPGGGGGSGGGSPG